MTGVDPALNRMPKRRVCYAFRRALAYTGLSLEEIAASLDTKPEYVEQIFREGCTPASRYFLTLCRLLDLDPRSFGFRGYLEKQLERQLAGGDADGSENT